MRPTRDSDHNTHLAWAQAFESAALADKQRDVVTAANEQNLARLEAVLRSA